VADIGVGSSSSSEDSDSSSCSKNSISSSSLMKSNEDPSVPDGDPLLSLSVEC
jgi:hypothetical protein